MYKQLQQTYFFQSQNNYHVLFPTMLTAKDIKTELSGVKHPRKHKINKLTVFACA